jgi:PadR family transcriptional regulator, regulatory protein AphA
MSLRHALLGALADEPRTGYSLLKHFQGSLAYAWPASHSQIYPELARLRDDGLIKQTSSGPRGSKTYELTEEGLAEVRSWLRETDPEHGVRDEAALRVFFLWLLDPKEAARYLDREAEYQRSVLEELEAIAAGESASRSKKARAYRVSLEAGLRLTRARIEWAEWAAQQYRRSRHRSAGTERAGRS